VHTIHPVAVLSRIRSANLTLGATKCKFAAAELDCLGHHIGLGNVHPRMKKVEALLAYPVPLNRKKLQLSLSRVGWILPEVRTKLRTNLRCSFRSTEEKKSFSMT